MSKPSSKPSRLIDTAQGYGNEEFIGEALAKTDVPREELFIVTKVWFKNYEDCRQSVLRSMEDLHVDYLDLVQYNKVVPAVNQVEINLQSQQQENRDWMEKLGIVIIPKTVNPARLRENLDVFDFELTAGDMQTLSHMDKAQPLIGNPQNPALVEMSAGW